MTTGTLKTCSKCQTAKDRGEYTKNANRSDGLHSWCKACKTAADTARLEKIKRDPIAWEAYRRRRHATVAAWRALHPAQYKYRVRGPRRGHDAADTKKRRDRLQGASLTGATNKNKQWTGPEMELLLRPDLTTQQVAWMIGRTYSGVMNMRTRIKYDPRKQVLAGVDRAEF